MQYKVVELREKMLKKTISPKRIEDTMNAVAAEGWRFKNLEINDRQARDQLFLIFERD